MQSHSLSKVFSANANDSVLCLATDRSGGQIAVGTSASCLVIDAKTGTNILSAEQQGGPVTAVAFSRDGQLLVGAQGALRLWDLKARKVLALLELREVAEGQEQGNEAVRFAAQPSGELFATASEHGRCCIHP